MNARQVLPMLLALGCASTTRYLAPLRMERSVAEEPIAVALAPIEYSSAYTGYYLPQGVFVARPIEAVFTNLTDSPALIDWDRSALVSPAGETLRIVHRGVLFADAKSGNYQTYQKRSLIAPRAKLSDVIVPVDWLELVLGEWQLCVVPKPGASYMLSLTVEIEGRSRTFGIPFVMEEGRPVE